MRQRREACRQQKKLLSGTELFERVVDLLRKHFSPEQIAGKLCSMNIRPRKHFNWKCPIAVMGKVTAMQHDAPTSIQ